MATVRLLRSTTPGNTPSSLVPGQLAINEADGKLFYRASNGAVTLLPTGGAPEVYEYATPANFPATGSAAQLVVATDTGRVYRWMGTAYVELGSVGGGTIESRWDLFLPAAPTGVTATAGNAQATVSWTAPTGVLAQAPVSDYVVQFSSNSGSTWTTVSRTASTTASQVVTSLTNGAAYTFRVAAVNGIGAGAYSTASAAVTPTAGDPLFANVSLLLPFDGTGSTFIDASAAPKTITAYDNATQSTAQSKFGGKSLALDGSGDYISIADSGDAFAFGTGDFCYEFWFRSAASNAYAALLTRPYNSAGGILMSLNGSSGNGAPEIYWREHENSLFFASNAGGFNDNNWHHYVFNRSGTTCRMFIDGVVRATRQSVSTGVPSSQVVVGNDIEYSGRTLNGYIDDLRITKGHSRGYTENFTPPTAAFPDSGPMSAPTSLTATAGNAQASLTWTAPAYNGGSSITDYSVQFSSNSGSTWTTVSRTASTTASQVVTGLTNGTAYVFRVAGVNANGTGTYTSSSNAVTPSAAATDPFFSSVSLLLPMDTAFTDISGTPKTVINNSGVISSAQVKNGAGSGLFNLSGGTDSLEIPYHADFSFQSGDSFTVECWHYPTSFGNYNYIISKGLGGSTREWALGVTGSSVVWYRQTGGADLSFTPAATVTLNQWTHLAAVCNGTTVTLYKDGVGLGSTAWGTPDGYSHNRSLWIMQFLDYRSIAHEGRGYIDNIRITKNVARYQANFTPSAAAFPTS